MRILAPLALILTPTLAMAQTVPNDGTWTSTPRDVSVSDSCPAEMIPALEQMAAQMTAPSSTEIIWNGTFDPTQASLGTQDDGIVWEQIGETTWEGTINLPNDGGELGKTHMTLLAEDSIESQTTMSIAAIMAAQGQTVPGLDGCEIAMIVDMSNEG